MNPFCIPFAITNMSGALLAMDLGFMGPNYAINTGMGSWCRACTTLLTNAAQVGRERQSMSTPGRSTLRRHCGCHFLANLTGPCVCSTGPFDTSCYCLACATAVRALCVLDSCMPAKQHKHLVRLRCARPFTCANNAMLTKGGCCVAAMLVVCCAAACATGNYCITNAADHISRGDADLMLAGEGVITRVTWRPRRRQHDCHWLRAHRDDMHDDSGASAAAAGTWARHMCCSCTQGVLHCQNPCTDGCLFQTAPFCACSTRQRYAWHSDGFRHGF